MEVLMVTPAVRNLIREGKTHQIQSSLQTGARYGMQTMDNSLRDLFRRGIISRDEALSRAINQETLLKLMDS
jgi:twitching motility protein PilT